MFRAYFSDCRLTTSCDTYNPAMTMKIMLILAIIVATAVGKNSDHRRTQLESCSEGTRCEEDIDCLCENKEVICNYKQVCKVRSFWDDLLRTKPCFRNYKIHCTSDVDCDCDGKLVCEDRECVEPRHPTLMARL
ncbi:uncharacterized protein [Montipora capricornis]|uniref:uncharacterized protein n=1 Tax=Montipora foliosa TaxID=591990 RepID=UPI0035F1D44B